MYHVPFALKWHWGVQLSKHQTKKFWITILKISLKNGTDSYQKGTSYTRSPFTLALGKSEINKIKTKRLYLLTLRTDVQNTSWISNTVRRVFEISAAKSISYWVIQKKKKKKKIKKKKNFKKQKKKKKKKKFFP